MSEKNVYLILTHQVKLDDLGMSGFCMNVIILAHQNHQI